MSLDAVNGMFATMELLRKQRNGEFDDSERRKRAQWDDEDRRVKMNEVNRNLAIRGELEQAAAPAQIVTSEEEQQGPVLPGDAPLPKVRMSSVNGKSFADQAAADEEAAAYNAPLAAQARMSQVMQRRGDATGAAALRVSSMKEQGAKLDLDDAQRADIKARFLDDLRKSVVDGDWDGLGNFMSESHADGRGGEIKFQLRPSADGKSREVWVSDGKGGLKATGKLFDNTPEGFLEARAGLEGIPTERMLAHIYQKRRDARAEQREDRLDARDAVRDQNESRRLDILEKQVDGKIAAGAAGAGAPPIWDDKADNFLRERYTIKDPNTGVTSVDGHGLQFAKVIAQASARDKFGGDTTRALGYAFELDAKVQQAAGGDPAKIRAGREEILRKLGAPAPDPDQPMSKAALINRDMAATGVTDAIVQINGTTRAYGNAKLPGAPAPAVRMSQAAAGPAPAPARAPTGAEVAQMLAVEQREMGEGKRMKFSPEVQAFVDGQKAAQREREKAEQAAYLAKELQRSKSGRL